MRNKIACISRIIEEPPVPTGSPRNVPASAEKPPKALVQFAPLARMELNRESKIQLWNPAAQQMLGWTVGEVIGKSNPTILSEGRAQYEKDVASILEGATIERKDSRRRCKDDRQVDVRVWAAPIRNERSEVTGLTVVLEDITEQKESEQQLLVSRARQKEVESQLERSEERMRLAFDAAKIGFWDWNAITREPVWSATTSRQMGLPADFPPSVETFMNAVHPDDRKAMQASIEAAVRDNTDHSLEHRVIWPDGSIHWRLAKGHAIYDKAGHPTRMVGVALDIDESKAAEQRLLLQSAALNAAANAIVITDNKGVILQANAAFSQLTGYASEEVLGQTARLLKSGKQDSSFYTNMWATITSGKTWRGEVINRRKDGSLYTEDMTITPVRDGDGQLTNYIAIKEDISDRILTEQALQRAEL